MFVILVFLLIISIIIEGSITHLPLVLICLINMAIIRRDWTVFVTGFIAGIFLDVFQLHILGQTSIFFLLFLFLILLYQRKYEISSYPFVLVTTGVGSALFLSVFGYGNVLLLTGVSVFLAVLLFIIVRLFTRFKEQRKHNKLHYTS